MKYGILTLVDHYPDEHTLSERYQQIIDMAVYAEQLGYDFFWVGEHHGSEFYCSPSPIPLLSAIAAKTKKIRVGPGACLLAHHEPIRLAEDYAMLDVISQGRVDMLIGRPTFMRGFHALNQRISEGVIRNQEGLELLRKLWAEESVSYDGTFFKTSGSECHPRPLQKEVPFYLACAAPGGARFAAEIDVNLSLLSIFGPPKVFRPTVDAYREASSTGLVSAGRHIFVDDTHEEAQQNYAPYFERYCQELRTELAYRPKKEFDIEQAPLLKGVNPLSKSLYASTPIQQRITEQTVCGSPDTVAKQMQNLTDDLGGLDSFWGLFDVGAMPTETILKNMTLFASSLNIK